MYIITDIVIEYSYTDLKLNTGSRDIQEHEILVWENSSSIQIRATFNFNLERYHTVKTHETNIITPNFCEENVHAQSKIKITHFL